MQKQEVILRFDDVTFEYIHKKPLLKDASFSVRKGDKITLMGQNGAGKSTLFGLITGEHSAKSGKVSVTNNASVATAKQVINRDDLDLSVKEYYEKSYDGDIPYNAPGKIKEVMEAVNLQVDTEKKVKDLSGGQQARLLLSYALIQEPDILLLDEPTNNLDDDGIDRLIQFLVMYEKTVIVISHDADFLNCFTEGVVYLDIFTKLTEKYVGDYYSVVEEIKAQVKRERMKNAQLEKDIKDKKEKINFFAHKGGKMRKLAKKMKDEVQAAEENLVDVRKDDKTIRDFNIPEQDISGRIVEITKATAMIDNVVKSRDIEIVLRRDTHLLITGPNGIGKSTFIKSLVDGANTDVKIMEGARIGYYSQDFENLDFSKTVHETLNDNVSYEISEPDMRSLAAGFLLYGDTMTKTVAELSEGQKGLLNFAILVLMEPGLIVLDEPSNHINFRHLPVIAKALGNYKGALIIVSHMKEFIDQIRIDEYLELSKIS
jgi:ATP-binding cassette, subfamily F, member 3